MRIYTSCSIIFVLAVLLILPTSGNSSPAKPSSPKIFLSSERRQNLTRKGGRGSSPSLVPLIYAGALSESFPFIVSIVQIEDDGRAQNLCGASLITDKHLLTAAHCLTGIQEKITNGDQLEAWIAPTDLDKFDGQKVKLKSIFAFPFYNGEESAYQHDLGLIELDKAVQMSSNVSPIIIGTGSYDSEPVTLIGFGLVDCVSPSRRLLKAQGKCIGKTKCLTMGHPENLLDSQLCAEIRDGNGELSDAGQGDSGGPLFQRIHGKYVQVGVVSYSYEGSEDTENCVTEIPGTYTRVGSFVPFIQRFASDAKFS